MHERDALLNCPFIYPRMLILFITAAYSSGSPLPSVVEELASMVAVSGEDLEDIARERNKLTPELK